MKNIPYQSSELIQYYSRHRTTWNEFYPSEKRILDLVFEKLSAQESLRLLDVGCACGGLANALQERHPEITSYDGIDINSPMVNWAKEHIRLSFPTHFYCCDILQSNLEKTYSLVLSLSCIDWNISVEEMLKTCWDYVEPGGYFLLSLRLTNQTSINDIKQAYQWIQYQENKNDMTRKETEKANYVVFHWKDALQLFQDIGSSQLEEIGGYGYWGPPSKTARVPYDSLCFTVFYLKKSIKAKENNPTINVNLPLNLLI